MQKDNKYLKNNQIKIYTSDKDEFEGKKPKIPSGA